MKLIIVILFSLILLASCGVFSRSKALCVDEYIEWYAKEKSVLTSSQEVSAIQYELNYVPYEFQVGYGLKQGDLNIEEAKGMQHEFTKSHSFKLTMVLPFVGKDIYAFNQTNAMSKEQKMLYFLNELHNDVLVVKTNGDTVKCENALLEQGISNMNVATFLFDFSSIERDQLKELVFKDRLVSEQTIVFEISPMNLTQIPKLSFKGYEK